MSKKIISFDLSARSIDRAIKELAQFKEDFQKKCEELLRRIAERLAEEAQNGFSGAIVDDLTEKSGSPRKASVNVHTENRGDYFAIVADGTDAVWVEFGAGVYHNGSVGSSPNPLATNATGVPNPPIAIGTFGKNGRKQTWGFYEDGELKITRGTPAAMPMYNAVQTVSREVLEIAREVFV